MESDALLKVVGAVLWWGEGSKSRPDKRWKNAVSYPVELTNNEPLVIKVFLRYIREIVNIPEEKIKLQIQIHVNDNKQELENFWSDVTGIPRSRFNKTIVRPVGNKPGKTKGTCKIRCYSKEFYGNIKSDLLSIQDQLSGCGAVG
jgi:hypothetical protein